jgi:hypothetical protein
MAIDWEWKMPSYGKAVTFYDAVGLLLVKNVTESE